MTGQTDENDGTEEELRGLHLLVVEDEAMIAFALEDLLTDLGCEVVGPVFRVRDAMQLAREAVIDGAILDVNIAGEEVFPVADILEARGIPFIFTTGYGTAGLRPSDLGHPVLQKPYPVERLLHLAGQWRPH